MLGVQALAVMGISVLLNNAVLRIVLKEFTGILNYSVNENRESSYKTTHSFQFYHVTEC